MPNLVDPAELVAATDIAALLGVTAPAVSNWKSRHSDFPSPIATVAGGSTDLWRREDVMRWWIAHNPQGVMLLRQHAEELLRLLAEEG